MFKEFIFKVYYFLTYPLTLVCLFLLLLYRKILRYLLRRSCYFIPSCSKYAWDSIVEFGWLFGGILTIKRLVKCRPSVKAGLDYPKLNLLGNYKWKC